MVGGYEAPQGVGRRMIVESRPLRWVYGGISVMLALIGVAVFLTILFPAQFRHSGMGYFPGWPFGVFWGLLWLFVVLWLFSWVFRWSWWTLHGPSRYRRYRGWYDQDSASVIARERYARGELTAEQFDKIMKDLDHPR